jgi:hypothetical protein
MEAADIWRVWPRHPGDPIPGAQERVVAPVAVVPPPEAPAAITPTGVKLEFDPDEAALRQRLVEARAELSGAEEALSYAAAAHRRAEEHLADATKLAASLLRTDDQTAAALAEALRDGRQPPDFDAGRLARDRAREDVARATSAVDLLRASHAEAAAAVGNAKVAINSTIAQLLGLAGELVATRRQQAIAAVEHDLLLLRGLAQSGAALGPSASDVLRGDAMQAGYHPADTSRWDELAEKLRGGDTEAPLTLD